MSRWGMPSVSIAQRAGNGVVALGRAEGAEGTTRSRSRSAWRGVPVRAKLKRSVGSDGTTWPHSQRAGNERGQTLLSRSYSLGSGLGWSGRERTAGDGGEGGWERRDGIGLAQTRQRGAGCEVDCVRCRLLEVIALGQCGVFSRASLILQLSRLRFLLVSSHCQALCGVLSRWQTQCPWVRCIAEQPTLTGSQSSGSFIDFDLSFLGSEEIQRPFEN